MYLMTALLGVATLSMVFTSCTEDNCKDVYCGDNGGLCNPDDGSCDCPVGYEGAACGERSKTKFLGSYQGTGSDDQGGTYSNWTVNITETDTTSTTAINIALLDDMNVQQLTFTGSIDENGIITLDNKTTTNFLYTLGSGTVTAGSFMNITFKEADNPGGTNPFIYTFNNMIKQ